ncbi:MAG: glycerol-3-phosphate dehydrogenase/oxidase [Gammaproteobacteria bacterium]|nr:glycerol-3-phosphate dehydrogenase/oxidase [Gammaproteobacteria bacterium]
MMSLVQRQQRLNKIKDQYDVAVIGGGIYGAATAWEAASRGLKVILIEAEDFCSGTSANSLKTIHGGLRSLQRFDFPEMREYIRERRALLRIAPHLVIPMQCVIPTFSKFSKSRLFLGTGLKVYDLIAYDRNRGLDAARRIKKTQIISAEKVRKFAPDLDSATVTGGASWFDAQAYNSERLVLAFIMSAKQAGADVFNYVRKKNYTAEQGAVTGVSASDQLTGEDIHIIARAVIDCTGPWVAGDEAFTATTAEKRRPKLMARAVNLVLNRKLSSCALGANTSATPDGSDRLMFIAPWRQGSIVGTWYYPQTSKANKQTLSDAELSQCLSQINSVFPSLALSRENVTRIHHGVQPAEPAADKNSEPDLWRHTRIIDSNAGDISAGLFWVQGVKLTTARATAEHVINRVAGYLHADISPSRTSVTALYGGEISEYERFEEDCFKELSDTLSAETITRLIRNYGSNISVIMRLCEKDQSLAQLVPGTDDTIKAELEFILGNEMVYTLSDLILRRTDIGSFECPGNETIEYCADIIADHLHWDSQQRAENIKQLIQNYPEWSYLHEGKNAVV